MEKFSTEKIMMNLDKSKRNFTPWLRQTHEKTHPSLRTWKVWSCAWFV